MKEVAFASKPAGVFVPNQPWPQTFVISRTFLVSDTVEVRPLTLTGFAKAVLRNFVTMTFWRLCFLLRRLGFLKTPECGRYHWRQFTLRFWRYAEPNWFRSYRWLKARQRRLVAWRR